MTIGESLSVLHEEIRRIRKFNQYNDNKPITFEYLVRFLKNQGEYWTKLTEPNLTRIVNNVWLHVERTEAKALLATNLPDEVEYPSNNLFVL
ncbi:MAG: hypothetical protein ACP5OA_03445 [Candidatus Woesearchaeota archaeon]